LELRSLVLRLVACVVSADRLLGVPGVVRVLVGPLRAPRQAQGTPLLSNCPTPDPSLCERSCHSSPAFAVCVSYRAVANLQGFVDVGVKAPKPKRDPGRFASQRHVVS
jgi:hypothetical protein